MDRRPLLSVLAVALVATGSGCGGDDEELFSKRVPGGASGSAGSGAGSAGMGGNQGGAGGRGASGGRASGGRNMGGTSGSSPCAPARCDGCACEAEACTADSDCMAVHACAIAHGCQTDYCLVEHCSTELGNAGGPESESAERAIAVTVCGASNGCGCVELGSNGPSCNGNRPEPVADVRCDNSPACSSRDLQFCCLTFGCLGTASECPTTGIRCDGPEDCFPGQLCCGKATASGTYVSLECSYSSFSCNRMCHVGDDSACVDGGVCEQSPSLPMGIGYCVYPL